MAWALISMERFEEAGRLVNSALKDNSVDQGGVFHAAQGCCEPSMATAEAQKLTFAEAIRVCRNFLHFHHTAYTIGAIYTTLGSSIKPKSGSRMRPATDSPITPSLRRMCIWIACELLPVFAHFSQSCGKIGSTFLEKPSDSELGRLTGDGADAARDGLATALGAAHRQSVMRIGRAL